MAWTQATPNGGNSAMTGNRNKNNNASANRQTANYGSSNAASSSSSSGDPRGNEGNNYTNYLTPAPKAPTPIYASPNEQGQNNPAPTPVVPTVAPPKIKLTMGEENDGYGVNRDVYEGSPYKDQFAVNSRNSFTEDAIEEAQQSSRDDWIKEWAKNLETGVTDNNKDFQDQLDNSSQGVKNNLSLIEKNTGAIDTNRDATGNEIRGVQSQVDSANDDLLRLDEIQKEYGYELVDVNGNVVDIQKDVIKNRNQQISGQKADLLERNAQEAATQKAMQEIDYQFADQYDTQAMFEDQTAEDFRLSDEQLDEIVTQQSEAGVDMENINSSARKRQKELQQADNNLRASLKLNEDRTYGQDYWVDRVRELRSNPETADQVSSIIEAERELLGDKAYSGDIVVDAQDQYQARENLMSILSQIGGVTSDGEPRSNYGASPAAPPEYIFEQTINNIDQWVADGLATVDETVSGMFDENTTKVYTLENGDVLTRKITSPIITDEDGKELFRLGDDVDTLFMNDVEIGTRKGDVTSVPAEGAANHIDSRVMVGDDNNPNSPANRPDGGNQNNTGGQGQSQGSQSETPVAPTDPVVGEDIPLPNDLTDPDGTGAYGQNGQPFSLDGVTFWKRIKDRNGRWTYTRLDSYQDNGTASRRAGLSNNVQNF